MAFTCACYIEVDYPRWQRDKSVRSRALDTINKLREASVKGIPVVDVIYQLDDSIEITETDIHFERYFGITLVLEGNYTDDFLRQDTRLQVTSDVIIILCRVSMSYEGKRDNLVVVKEEVE